MAVDASGNVYVADRNNNLVEKVTPAGTLSIIAGTGTSGAPTPGPATNSNLDFATGVAVDASGNVYIADTHNQRVEKVGAPAPLPVVPEAPAAFALPASAVLAGAAMVVWRRRQDRRIPA